MASDSSPNNLCSDCESFDGRQAQSRRRLIFFILAAVGLIVSLAITWFVLLVFVLNPKPAFVLQGATVHEFNATSSSLESLSPNFLSMNMEAALSSHNPSGHFGIRYFQLRAYASYHGKQITLPAQLPKSYQGAHKDVTDWSLVLQGNMIAITPDLGSAMAHDLNTGSIPINVKVDGLVKPKPVVLWPSKYRLHVNCPTVLMPKASGIEVQKPTQHCSVKVKLAIF